MAFTRKLPSGKFLGIAKDGRTRLGSKAFTKQRDAKAWAERLETAAAGGLDVKAGKSRLKTLIPQWLEYREHAVAPLTLVADRETARNITPGLNARAVGSIKRTDIEKWLLHLHKQGQSHSSVQRRRASLGAFFSWLVDENIVADNPVQGAKQPALVKPKEEMRPFSEAELNEVVRVVGEDSQRLADIILVLGWSGIRWGEARALRVGDVRRDGEGVPTHLRVQRSRTEGQDTKVTKGRSNRTVPVVGVIAPAVDRLAAGKSRDSILISAERGGPLWGRRFMIQSDWKNVTNGRRIYDTRHTAACLWLSKGVDLSTVSSWLGHSSVSITDGYLHYLGRSADDAAVARINAATITPT